MNRPLLWIVLLVAIVGAALPVRDAAAAPIAEVVSDNPVDWTPDVLNGQVEAIAQVGDLIIIGGTFTQVEDDAGVHDRSRIAAFDATTGVVDPGFDPALDGAVKAIIPAGDGTSVFVTGGFNTIDGVVERKVAKLDLSTGARVAGFDTPYLLSQVRDARLVGDELIIAGSFTDVGNEARTALASLDAATGAVTSFVDLAFAGVHSGGSTLVSKIETTPDGQKLLVIGNFTSVEAQTRDQVALIDLSGPTATLANWYTPFFESQCSPSFNTFMRDLDIDATGQFAVISTTGAYRGGIDAGVSCDTISRWELNATGTDLEATWATYTGGDTTYAVEIGPGVVYAGGHMRWVNNPYAGDRTGPGAIPREGIVALDTVNGMPFSWDPGRARGIGVFDMLLTDAGLWAGSDTDRWGGEIHKKVAMFPTTPGTDVEAYRTGSLPNHVSALGRIAPAGTPDPAVLYRVNAGGPALPSADDGPDWESDTATTSPYRNSGSNRAGWPSIHYLEPEVPAEDFDRVPLEVFATERWDPSSGEEMTWSFPVAAGTPIQVRLYFANQCPCTDEPGDRVFDVDVEGTEAIDELDMTDDHGHQTAIAYSFDIVSDGAIDVVLRHVVENPLINGIEIVQVGVAGGGAITSNDDAVRRFLDPATGADAPVATTGTEAWRWARGGFLVDSTVYTGWADGSMMRRSLDAGTWGAPTRIALFGNNAIPDMYDVTGMFFDPTDQRIYYTLDGDSALYWRWFTPESHSVGATAFTASGAIGSLDPARVQGMFLADGWIYFADAATGNLMRIGFGGGVVTGSATSVDTGSDWRSRALIVSDNQAPITNADGECTFRDCAFDGTGSTDPDGTIVSYEWDFGDGSTDSGATVSHTYEDLGPHTATLTVTDNEGLTATTVVEVTTTNAPPVASFTANCDWPDCEFDGSGSTDDGSIVTYEWDFGDGSTDSGATVSHTYDKPGDYDVTLTVTDNDGATDDVTVTVESPAPVHLFDLMPRPFDREGDQWVSRTVVKVRDADGFKVEGVVITAKFGLGKIRTCTTNAEGKCKVKAPVPDSKPKIPLEIIEVQWPGGYDPSANVDTDGDGNGATTRIFRPF
jgi:PKD repeat protein